MSLTIDPKDHRLGRGIDAKQVPQHEAYLILSAQERAKGFVRPVRRSYRHDGERPKNPTRPLTDEEKERYAPEGYVAYEPYDPNEVGAVGRLWTAAQLAGGCGEITMMAQEIAETYAREPKFYGATYCVGCQKHLPVEQFVWVDDGMVVGS